MKKIILFSLFLLLLIALLGCQNVKPESQPKQPIVTEIITQEFDIPTLLGKSFAEVEKIIGKPTNQYEVKDSYWVGTEIHFTKTGTDVSYDKETVSLNFELNLYDVPIKIYLCANSKSGTRPFQDFLKAGNLRDDATEYSLKGVKAISNPSEYTCVEIIKK